MRRFARIARRPLPYRERKRSASARTGIIPFENELTEVKPVIPAQTRKASAFRAAEPGPRGRRHGSQVAARAPPGMTTCVWSFQEPYCGVANCRRHRVLRLADVDARPDEDLKLMRPVRDAGMDKAFAFGVLTDISTSSPSAVTQCNSRSRDMGRNNPRSIFETSG